jgi:hypothetical protein
LPLPVDVPPLQSERLARAPAREIEKLDEVSCVGREVRKESPDVFFFEETLPRVVDPGHVHQGDAGKVQ